MPVTLPAAEAHHRREERRPAARRLWVTWQNPQTRAMLPVGCLVEVPDGTWSFRYVARAHTVPGFRPFASFPELNRKYQSDRLFPMFANRVMSPRRPDYAEYLSALDLQDDATPFDILARSSGGRATDRVRVYPEPAVDSVTRVTSCIFLAHGVRHLEGASERAERLRAGDRLQLRSDPLNPSNPRALLLDAEFGLPVGYVPEFLLDYVHAVREYRGAEVRVDRVNPPPAPVTLRLLCWLAGRWPPGQPPFTGPEYEPIPEPS
jgi:hypothetical protein